MGEQNPHFLEFGSMQSLNFENFPLSLLGILQAKPGWSSYIHKGKQDKRRGRVLVEAAGSGTPNIWKFIWTKCPLRKVAWLELYL